MRSTRGAFFALALLGGYFVWRNRFSIQKQLESMGIKTPTLGGDFDLSEKAQSLASKVSGKFERGVTNTENEISDTTDRKVGNY